MDLNKSIEFNSSSETSPQMQNFLPMSSSKLPSCHQPSKHKKREEARQSRLTQTREKNLANFWNQQLSDIQSVSANKIHHQLPLARIKRIMKADRAVKMISADTPVVFSKACELFIMELTLRSWLHTEECKRKTLQRCDIATAIKNHTTSDFLADTVPYDHYKDDEIENCDEESLPTVKVPYPMIDINEDYVLPDDEIPHQFMSKPLVSSTDFHYESDSK